MSLRGLSLTEIIKTFELVHEYELNDLKKVFQNYFISIVNEENVSVIIEMAKELSCDRLLKKCWIIIEILFNQEANVSTKILMLILMQKERHVPEVKLLEKLCHIFKDLTPEAKKQVLSNVQFEKLTMDQMFEVKSLREIFGGTILIDKIEQFALRKAIKCDNCQYAGRKIDEDKEFLKYLRKTGRGKRSHLLYDKSDPHILLDLEGLHVINYIQFGILLDPPVNYEAAYYVEVSPNGNDWVRVVDYKTIYCRLFQYLSFPEIAVKYIKIVGTKARKYTAKGFIDATIFQIMNLNALYVKNPLRCVGGFLYPEENIAIHRKAFVNFTDSDGIYRSDTKLLDVADKILDKPRQYTAQHMKYGSLFIFLHQPYILQSCRFLLWDLDGSKYSYILKITSDEENYEVISDTTEEPVDGWQTVEFGPCVVKQFEFIITDCTKGREFKIVHFEAPSMLLDI